MKRLSSITTLGVFALSALVILNITLTHSLWLGIPTFFLLMLCCGGELGSAFFPSLSRAARTLVGMLLAMAWIMIMGSVFYYAWKLNIVAISITVFSIPLFAFVWKSPVVKIPIDDARAAPRVSIITLTAAFLIFVGLAFHLLAKTHTPDSVRSPWEVLPWQFFLMMFLAATALVMLGLMRSRVTILGAMLFSFLFFSVAALVYPLGYGFDPFIHQATEKYISEHGTITPKPFFYIGQYALVNTVHATTALPIVPIDRFLLPVLLAVFLPLAAWIAFRHSLAPVLILLLPMTTFASTTPQGVANALVLITVLIAIGMQRDAEVGRWRDGVLGVAALWLLGIATTFTHPIAGVPLLFFLLVWTLWRRHASQNKIKIFFTILFSLLASIALPALFALYGMVSGAGNSLRPDALAHIPGVLRDLFFNFVGFESRFTMLLDFAYLYRFNITFLLLLGALLTFFFLWQRARASTRVRLSTHSESVADESAPRAGSPIILLLPTSFITFINAVLLLAAIDFSFLPLYEQSGYADRLLDLARLFLFPLFILGLTIAIPHIIKKNALLVRAATIALFAGLIMASLYLTYPHADAYTVEHGWSVGQTDIDAVHFIEKDAAGKPHIALANQAVSAAALREFGFAHYYPLKTEDNRTESAFYYPIPTGGPLYQYFLRMSYDAPRRATITDAMGRADVKLGYFVVNSYWTGADVLIERAKGQADAWQQLGGGKVFVFRFEK